MNIFYYSVHQILEDDEVRLFKSLGHNVFCLGANGRDGATQGFRPAINFSDLELSLYDEFKAMGGEFEFGNVGGIVIPTDFVQKFDLFIIMHDVNFIIKFWNMICRKAVVWRTIGQGVEVFEDTLKIYREAGLLIIRYSPVEIEYEHSLGQDAIIRFGKNEQSYAGWSGSNNQVITFSNLFKQRYPLDFIDYSEIVKGIPSVLGGIGNEESPNAIGLVDVNKQMSLLQESRMYLYASGLYIPYTLNFIEAWMMGIPVIVHAPYERRDKYFEIDRLINDGVNGFVCRDVQSARERVHSLSSDHDFAARIGAAGRRAALDHFSEAIIAQKWKEFFDSIPTRPSGSPLTSRPAPTEANNVKNMSIEVFDALSLLTPFDINVEKTRFGNPRDGGYVLAELSSRPDVLSFGVGPDVTFEYEMAERGRRVFLNDHTVDGTPQQHPRFHFAKTGICGTGGTNIDLMTLGQHLERIGDSETQLILKMDVEGYEWEVFSTIDLEVLERFEQITLEVHWLENLADPTFRNKVVASLSKINKLFTLFHVHANNCAELHIVDGFTVASVLELSYVRSNLVRRSPSTEIYPSTLDLSNHPFYHDHALLFFPFLPSTALQRNLRAVVKRLDMEKKLSAPT